MMAPPTHRFTASTGESTEPTQFLYGNKSPYINSGMLHPMQSQPSTQQNSLFPLMNTRDGFSAGSLPYASSPLKSRGQGYSNQLPEGHPNSTRNQLVVTN